MQVSPWAEKQGETFCIGSEDRIRPLTNACVIAGEMLHRARNKSHQYQWSSVAIKNITSSTSEDTSIFNSSVYESIHFAHDVESQEDSDFFIAFTSTNPHITAQSYT